MLTSPATPEMVDDWKRVHERYKNKLRPNRKSGREIVEYLKSKYTLTPRTDKRALNVIRLSVLENPHLKEKLQDGQRPEPVAFLLNDNGQEAFVGVDLASGYCHVEGSEQLYDELCAFQGLDKFDLKNCFLVAQYINCLEKHGGLEEALQNG